jgi:flagellar biosynthesis protein FliQ
MVVGVLIQVVQNLQNIKSKKLILLKKIIIIMKKEIIYTMNYETKEDIKKAEKLRSNLYEKYNSVNVYPSGLNEIQIIATDN